ncbi:hypothetical protein FF1_028074 [Malus domestica]
MANENASSSTSTSSSLSGPNAAYCLKLTEFSYLLWTSPAATLLPNLILPICLEQTRSPCVLEAINRPVFKEDLVTVILKRLGGNYSILTTVVLNFPLPSFIDLGCKLLSFEAQNRPPTADAQSSVYLAPSPTDVAYAQSPTVRPHQVMLLLIWPTTWTILLTVHTGSIRD